MRPVRGPHPQPKLPGIERRENLDAQPLAADPNHRSAARQVSRQHRPAEPHHQAGQRLESLAKPAEQTGTRFGVPRMPLQQPRRQHGHKGAGQQVGRDHREAHRQRQRHEQLAGCPAHEERGHEHRQHAQHRQQPRHGGQTVPLANRPRHGSVLAQLDVDVLDLDGGLVHENADRQGQATQRHQIDRMPADPQAHNRRHEGQGNVHDDDQRAPHVAEKDQHHQARQQGPQCAFVEQALHRPSHIRRLVELETDADVLGQLLLHLRQGALDFVDHAHRRRFRPLRRQDVDGPAAVDQRIARGQVGGVLDGADVAQVHRAVRTLAERNRAKILQVLDQGIGRHHGIEVAQMQIA